MVRRRGGILRRYPARQHNLKRSSQWTLATDDTEAVISVSDNKIFLAGLKNPAQKWNWTPAPSEVPLPGKESVAVGGTAYTPNWTFRDATEDKSNGHAIILRFTSATPSLELKSVWRAYPGPGPVENRVTIESKSDAEATFAPSIEAAHLQVKADRAVHLHRAEKTQAGKGKVFYDALAPNAKITTGSQIIPFVILDVAATHGMYLGYEWELGGFRIAAGSDPLDITASAHPITEKVTRGKNRVFTIPGVYYGTYRGDIDDGSNRFKKWFWNHKITRSLHEHADEPWVEACMQDIGGNGSASVTGGTPQSAYDRLAAAGAELVKMDFWDGTGKGWYTNRDWQFHPAVWPNGFDFAAKAHRAGLKASLYMGGTYNDCDLATIAGRDAELAAVLTRFDWGWFDVWRTDLYTAPEEPMPQTYEGVTNFLYIQDYLIENRPGYRYENCCNGGKYKGFAICRRMTFCTMNDVDQDPNQTRSTYYSNSFAINPVQLKSDLGPASTPFQLRTDMLGAILTWAADNPVYRQHISLYKTKQRPILRGRTFTISFPWPTASIGMVSNTSTPNCGKAPCFSSSLRRRPRAATRKSSSLKAWIAKARYTLTFQDRTNLNCTMAGAELMDTGVNVTGMTGDSASEIIWIDTLAPTASST